MGRRHRLPLSRQFHLRPALTGGIPVLVATAFLAYIGPSWWLIAVAASLGAAVLGDYAQRSLYGKLSAFDQKLGKPMIGPPIVRGWSRWDMRLLAFAIGLVIMFGEDNLGFAPWIIWLTLAAFVAGTGTSLLPRFPAGVWWWERGARVGTPASSPTAPGSPSA